LERDGQEAAERELQRPSGAELGVMLRARRGPAHLARAAERPHRTLGSAMPGGRGAQGRAARRRPQRARTVPQPRHCGRRAAAAIRSQPPLCHSLRAPACRAAPNARSAICLRAAAAVPGASHGTHGCVDRRAALAARGAGRRLAPALAWRARRAARAADPAVRASMVTGWPGAACVPAIRARAAAARRAACPAASRAAASAV